MIRRNPLALLILVCVGCCFGCSAHDPIAALEVLKHGNCTITEPGVQTVRYEDLAQLRGSKLLAMTTTPASQDTDLLLLAVSKGRQPTPGYSFELLNAFNDAGIATVEVRWIEPPKDAVLAQMITHPCIVIGLQRGEFAQLRAIDDQGNRIGELSISQAD